MKCISFIDYHLGRCYLVSIDISNPWSTPMTGARPSTVLMTAFVLAAAVLVAAAASPFLQVAAHVVA